MRKVYIFAGFVLALFVFACTIPTSIEIKGTPRIKFAANLDFNDMFSDMIGGAFDSGDGENGFKMLDCVNVSDYRTFLIRMEIIDRAFEFELEDFLPGDFPDKIVIDGNEYEITNVVDEAEFELKSDAHLVEADSAQEPMKIDFSSLSESLSGFSFDASKVKARLYINGSEIIGNINIDLFLGNQKTEISNIVPTSSGIDDLTNDDNEYIGIDLPVGGQVINIASLLNSKEEIEITYDVFMPAGKTIQVGWLGEVNIVAELLVWVPLDLVATGNDGAELAFPDDFMSGVGDFVNTITEVMDSLSLVIEMNVNPFAEGTLVVKSGDIRIENPLSATALNFVISENDMKAILDADSFEPGFSIVFEKDEHLRIPRELKITTISLEAKLHYNIDFNEEGEEE